MDRAIAQAFEAEKVFAAYVTAGDGPLEDSVEICCAMVDSGVGILEIGIPFSDPIADGPVIQAAMARALGNGATPETALELVRRVRARSAVPIVLFGYYNTFLQGGASLLRRAKESGVDGVLVVDLPVEEAGEMHPQLKSLALDTIQVVAPSTSPKRLQAIAESASGFVYYACQKGTTGMRDRVPDDLSQRIAAIRRVVDIPILVGFGIGDKAATDAVLESADGFVVGSALVAMIGEGYTAKEIAAYVRLLRPAAGVEL